MLFCQLDCGGRRNCPFEMEMQLSFWQRPEEIIDFHEKLPFRGNLQLKASES
jgi:hypothetical protein